MLSFENIEEDQEFLEEDWKMLAEKYRALWKNLAEKIANVSVYYTDTLGNDKKAFGLTQDTSKGLQVLFWSILTKVNKDTEEAFISDDEYWEILLHEMCHCAAYFVDGSLDHGKTWQYFVDKLNSCGYNITQESKLFDNF